MNLINNLNQTKSASIKTVQKLMQITILLIKSDANALFLIHSQPDIDTSSKKNSKGKKRTTTSARIKLLFADCKNTEQNSQQLNIRWKCIFFLNSNHSNYINKKSTKV